MRKIHFDEATIKAIKDYAESGHTVKEVMNRFTIKYDTLRRVMYENNIHISHRATEHSRIDVSESDIQLVCTLYSTTDMPMEQLCKEAKLENYIVQKILSDNFTEEYRNKRKSRIYRNSKIGDKNPMKQLTGDKHPRWIGGVVSDGQGYLMVKKPEWYTGRKGSSYVFLHSVVVCEALGITEIPAGFVVHHIDRNPYNNDISNLCLLSISAHSKLHSLESKMCKVQRLSNME